VTTATTSDLPVLFRLLGDLYLQPPTAEARARWLEVLAGCRSDRASVLRQALEDLAAAGVTELEELELEFARLFIGPQTLPCPPWESMYTSPRRQMLQEAHDAVAGLYAEAGFQVAGPGILPDHIGAELGFLSLLLERAAAAAGSAQEDFLRLADRLLDEHLNQWVPAFTADIETTARMSFYQTVARTTRDLIAAIQD